MFPGSRSWQRADAGLEAIYSFIYFSVSGFLSISHGLGIVLGPEIEQGRKRTPEQVSAFMEWTSEEEIKHRERTEKRQINQFLNLGTLGI